LNETIEKNDFHQAESLSKTVARGGIWIFGLRIVNRGFALIRTIILARLLAPHDFGLFGIAVLAISTIETFSQTGFQAALVQKKNNIESYLDTAWTISAIRGIILFLILFSSAPIIAKFFDSAQVTLIIKVIAVSTLLSGFRSISIVFFQKQFEFNKQFYYEISATFVGLTVAIILAFILRNVWALVWGELVANFVRVFMSYIIYSYRPRIKLEKEKIHKLFGFGKWVMGSSMLSFLIIQGDDIFVGKMLGVTVLGLYQMAYLISNLPTTEITHVISQVTFPAYSKLQDNLPKLRESYLKVLQLTAILSFPIAGLIFALAPDFIKIFLGEKWMPMVPAMQIMVLFGLIRSIGATTGPIFDAVGRPDIGTKIIMAKFIIFAVIIYPFIDTWGIVGAAWATVLNALIMNPVADYQVIKIIRCTIWIFCKSLIIPFINTTFMLAILFSLKKFLIPSITSFNFLVLILVGFSVYFFATFIFDKALGYELIPTLKQQFIASFRKE